MANLPCPSILVPVGRVAIIYLLFEAIDYAMVFTSLLVLPPYLYKRQVTRMIHII